MISNGISDRYFQFKTITPIFQPVYEKITDPDYWTNKEWNYKVEHKAEAQINKKVGTSLNRLKMDYAYNIALGEQHETDEDKENDCKEDQIDSFLKSLSLEN